MFLYNIFLFAWQSKKMIINYDWQLKTKQAFTIDGTDLISSSHFCYRVILAVLWWSMALKSESSLSVDHARSDIRMYIHEYSPSLTGSIRTKRTKKIFDDIHNDITELAFGGYEKTIWFHFYMKFTKTVLGVAKFSLFVLWKYILIYLK